jgi:hypothetical protein
VLLFVDRPRLDELRLESEWVLLLLERPLLAPIRPPWLLSLFFVGILNHRQNPATPRETHPRAIFYVARQSISSSGTNRRKSALELTSQQADVGV